VLVGIGALLAGTGIFVGMLALAKTLARLRITLDGVDRQVESIGTPVTDTLFRIDGVARSVEDAVGSIARTADLARGAVVPAIVNVGATLTGISAGLRRLVTGKSQKGKE